MQLNCNNYEEKEAPAELYSNLLYKLISALCKQIQNQISESKF